MFWYVLVLCIIGQILWPDGIFITKHPKRQRRPPSRSQPQNSPSSQLASPKIEVKRHCEKVDNLLTEEHQELEAVRRANFVRELMIGKSTFSFWLLFSCSLSMGQWVHFSYYLFKFSLCYLPCIFQTSIICFYYLSSLLSLKLQFPFTHEVRYSYFALSKFSYISKIGYCLCHWKDADNNVTISLFSSQMWEEVENEA